MFKLIIKNFRELTFRSDICSKCLEARRYALEAVNVGVEVADPERAVRKFLKCDGEHVIVGGYSFKPKRIFVVGAGKASYKMAKAIEEILNSKICDGVIAVYEGLDVEKLEHIRIVKAQHPIPGVGSLEAGKEILSLVSKASEGDLVLTLISGGGSALMEFLAPGVTLEDLKRLTNVLLKCGATIQETNTVRKHISQIKGGWLAKRAYPATVVSLIISDVVGDPIEFIASGPTAPDTTTFKDAIEVLKKYQIWDKVPQSIREHLEKGARGFIEETPKPGDPIFNNVKNLIIASNIESLKAMKDWLEDRGFNTIILTSRLTGEARVVGEVIASIMIEIHENNHPIPKPAAILAGGETTVTVRGKGVGGRNLELTLSASKILNGKHGLALTSIGSDGIDGITNVAGGVVDGESWSRSLSMGLNPEEILKENDSLSFFKTLNDYVYTGPTGTNVNDLLVGIVL